MKDVYVIKVKTKPPLSSLYPSERRYSASTIGGLSLVHLGLGILSFLLGALARSLQGPVLALACLVPFISGLLAWRRWYIDKNISFFFYGSLFSLVISILCGVATIFDIVSLTENEMNASWKLEDIFDYPSRRFENHKTPFIDVIEQNNTNESFTKVTKDEIERDVNCNDTFLDDYEKSENLTDEIMGLKLPAENMDHDSSSSSSSSLSDKYFNVIKNRVFSFLRDFNPSAENRANILLDINVLVTCILEISWSLLSVRMSLRGMRNDNQETTRYDNNFVSKNQRVQNRAPNPVNLTTEEQIYSRDENNVYDENLRNFGYRINSIAQNSALQGPRLPLPESNKEFRERVERFLANQAAHRIVEGSCS